MIFNQHTSPYFLNDLLGNVWEWVENDASGYTACGGSYRSRVENLHPGLREHLDTDVSRPDLGFRVVLDLSAINAIHRPNDCQVFGMDWNSNTRDLNVLSGPLFSMLRGGGFLRRPGDHCLIPPFAMGCNPVTVDEYLEFLRETGKLSKNFAKQHPNRSAPITKVTRSDAQQYCTWLTKKLEAIGIAMGGRIIARLPTELEWEYAARAGAPHDAPIWWKSDDPYYHAWYSGRGLKAPEDCPEWFFPWTLNWYTCRGLLDADLTLGQNEPVGAEPLNLIEEPYRHPLDFNAWSNESDGMALPIHNGNFGQLVLDGLLMAEQNCDTPSQRRRVQQTAQRQVAALRQLADRLEREVSSQFCD